MRIILLLLLWLTTLSFSAQLDTTLIAKNALSWDCDTSAVLHGILIEATRASFKNPIAYSEMTSKEIAALNNGQDIPYLLRFTPSLVATSDAGNGIGYTGLWIRGSDPSRINVTINGIPLNDPESQQVFWVNTPDFASSVDNIQIQRGVGTSANGAASFGGCIKMETRSVKYEAYSEINNAYGSFNTWKNNVSFGTGMLKNHFSIEGRLSRIASDGYIDRAKSDLKSFFIEANYLVHKTSIKLLAFGGRENTYQSWNGTPYEILYGNENDKLNFATRNYLDLQQTGNLLASGRTYNYYQYKNQVDNYGQDHFQFHYSRLITNQFRFNASAHYTHGQGYFEEFKKGDALIRYGLPVIVFDSNLVITQSDIVRRRWLDNDFYGGVFSLVMQQSNWESVLGGALSEYKGNHFGEINWIQYAAYTPPDFEYYRGKSLKRDANVYWKNNFTIKQRLDVLMDIQMRTVDYITSGTDNDLRDYNVSNHLFFINPKMGINYRRKKEEKMYLSAAIGAKEPNRNDLVDAINQNAIKPEKMIDFEAGYQLRHSKWNVGINFYDMIYKDQLVLTGVLNDVGAPLRTNVANSFRRGIELEGGCEIIKGLKLVGNITISQNKIETFKEVIYNYSNNAEAITTKYNNTDISFSPSAIGAAQISYRYEADKNYPNRDAMEFSFMTKYVGKQFMDNTQNESLVLDAYLINDFRFIYELTLQNHHYLTMNFVVHNLFDLEYSSNGYTYSYIYESRIAERFYYPQAGRNFIVSLGLKL